MFWFSATNGYFGVELLIAKIIINCKFIKGGSTSAGHTANLIKYMATRDGVSYANEETNRQPATEKQKELISQIPKENKECYRLHEYADYAARPTKSNASELITAAAAYDFHKMGETSNLIEYMAKRPGADRKGAHGLFSMGEKEIDLQKAMKEISEHKGHIWTMIVSLRREDAERLNYNTYEAWKNLLNSQAVEISKSYGIPLERLQYYGAFHNESHHPHMHVVIFSKDGTSGHLSQEGIRRVKSRFANEIFQNEMYHLYEQKTDFREQIKVASEQAVKKLMDGINNKAYDNSAVEKLLQALAADMKEEKHKTYGRIRKKEILTKIDAVAFALSQEPDIKELYGEWLNTHKQVCEYYKFETAEPPPLYDNEEFKSIKNMIIKKALEIADTTEPELIGDTPELAEFEPEYIGHEPEHIEHEPEHIEHEPEHIRHGPEHIRHGPEHTEFEPEEIYYNTAFTESPIDIDPQTGHTAEHRAQHLNNGTNNNYSPLVKLLANMLQESYARNYRAFTDKKLFRKMIEKKLTQGLKME